MKTLILKILLTGILCFNFITLKSQLSNKKLESQNQSLLLIHDSIDGFKKYKTKNADILKADIAKRHPNYIQDYENYIRKHDKNEELCHLMMSPFLPTSIGYSGLQTKYINKNGALDTLFSRFISIETQPWSFKPDGYADGNLLFSTWNRYDFGTTFKYQHFFNREEFLKISGQKYNPFFIGAFIDGSAGACLLILPISIYGRAEINTNAQDLYSKIDIGFDFLKGSIGVTMTNRLTHNPNNNIQSFQPGYYLRWYFQEFPDINPFFY